MPIDNYTNFEDKSYMFGEDLSYPDNRISDIETFNKWYDSFPDSQESNQYDYFFRGMPEAKFKLYNSAQREWISNNMSEWRSSYKYLQFIKDMIEEAKRKPLFKNVLAYHQINYDSEADFPILSILQHYGAPTPLMDWTYNLDVALYFATENINAMSASDTIDGYFSIYMIQKNSHENLKNIFEFSKPDFPCLAHFHTNNYIGNRGHNFACYISDFEINDQPGSTINSNVPAQNMLQRHRPLTTYYNQNIIPQQGLFIFNPSDDQPLEEIFSFRSFHAGTSQLKPVSVFLLQYPERPCRLY